MKDDTPDFKYEYMNDIKKCIIINIFNNYLRYEEKIYTIVDDRIEKADRRAVGEIRHVRRQRHLVGIGRDHLGGGQVVLVLHRQHLFIAHAEYAAHVQDQHDQSNTAGSRGHRHDDEPQLINTGISPEVAV